MTLKFGPAQNGHLNNADGDKNENNTNTVMGRMDCVSNRMVSDDLQIHVHVEESP